MNDQAYSASDLPEQPAAVLPQAVQRQRDMFGRVAIDPLLVNLRERLATALNASPMEARAVAHQLGGFAGVLGFAELAKAWETYSVEGESRLIDAQNLARSTLATLRQADLIDSGS